MTAREPFNPKRWRSDPAGFVEKFLVNPESGEPFKLLPAERVFLEHAFKFGADGRMLYPELVYSCPKKSGKTAFAAMFALVMIILYGGKYAEALCAPNDLEQSIGRVFQACRRIVEQSPLLRSAAKVTSDRIVIGDATITAIASEAASAAGSNAVISIFDELWGFTSERSRRLWDECVPPPTRKVACRLTTTYAGFVGESVLLEELYARGKAQPQIAPDLYGGAGILMFWSRSPVANWQTPEWIEEMRRSLRPNQFARMIENRFVSGTETFIDLAQWDACVDPGLSPVIADQNLPCFLACDAGWKSDSAAIVATTWDAKELKVRLVAHKVFEPAPGNPVDFERDIEPAILDMQRRFAVNKVLVDPNQMAASMQRLARKGVPIEEFPQTMSNVTAVSQNLYELVTAQNLIAYPDATLRLAISRAVAVTTPRGWRIDKENRHHKIDAVIALAMAAHGAASNQTAGAPMWHHGAFLVAGAPAPVPKIAGLLFAVIAPSKGNDIGVSYFAARPLSPLYILAVEQTRVAPTLFEHVNGRLDKFRKVINPAPEMPIQTPIGRAPMLLAVIYTSAGLRDMAVESGYAGGGEVIDKILDDELMVAKAGMLVRANKAKACADAVATAGLNFLHGLADLENPMQRACMAGILLGVSDSNVARAA